MGIKNLNQVIKTHAPGAITTCTFEAFSGRKVAVDVSIYLYQFVHNNAKKGKGSYLRGFFELIYNFYQLNIFPIFVFDGKAGGAKRATIDKRKESLESNLKKIEELSAAACKDSVELDRLSKNTIVIDSCMMENLYFLFSVCGVETIFSDSEADFTCAALYKQGIVHAVISEDMDLLTHGVEVLIRGLTQINYHRAGEISVYSLPACLEFLGQTHAEFIDMCILLGCDYTSSVTGIGPVTAVNLMRTYKSIDTIAASMTKYDFRGCDWELARLEFNKSNDVVLKTPINLNWGELMLGDIYEFLMLNTNYTDKTLSSKLSQLESLSKRKKVVKIRLPSTISK